MQQPKILIAAGGTGGHLFPAQALADQLFKSFCSPLFAGAGLAKNPFFDRETYSYYDVPSMTPFGGKNALLKAPWILLKGVFKSLKILRKERVSVVVGFGSYHTFPLLVAAWITRTPLILFEPNAFPGKVNRLFAKKARFTALQFSDEKWGLTGDTRLVQTLTRCMELIERQAAARYFSLSAGKKTLLIFGGSQGARTLNQWMEEGAAQLASFADTWQILHFVGHKDDPNHWLALYHRLGILACVKEFEPKMAHAWSLADLVIGRAGASAVAEQMQFAVPALYVPFPHATDDHQTKNALRVVALGGARLCPQSGGCAFLFSHLHELMSPAQTGIHEMKNALEAVKQNQDLPQLSSLILEIVAHGH